MIKIKFLILILILYSSIYFTYAGVITCYNCNTTLTKISDLEKCNSTNSGTENCDDQDNFCGSISSFLNKTQHVYYHQSCVPHDVCADTHAGRTNITIHFECCSKNLCNGVENLSYSAKQNISRALNSIHNTTIIPTTIAYRTISTTSDHRTSSIVVSPTFSPSGHSSTSNAIQNSSAGSLLLFWTLGWYLYKKLF